MKKSDRDFKKQYEQEWPIKCKDHIDAFAESIWVLRESWESIKLPPPVSINISAQLASEIQWSNHPALEVDKYRRENDPNYIGSIAGVALMKTIPPSQNQLTNSNGRKVFGDFF